MVYLFVGLAGTLGAILRYAIGITFFTHSTFPFTTLFINLIGSFLLAWLTTNLFKRISVSPLLVSAIGTGFVGSFTTFSTLSVETVTLLKDGELLLGIIYIFVSIFGGLLMSRIGFKVSGEAGKS
ncbi:fluoride efflux transporter FluC [Peribacillus deserti]|uniref:Fluoride-specific ion channel FluC n=1 Tax=Peribacillus deserti TaxID=673318 RepID=A0A2N5LZS1_9BACI|nr:CrcB family protein [Peribacillus deserti]PLT27523.1 fluoride efflux transporter CrcB [Peribacillus deserti]